MEVHVPHDVVLNHILPRVPAKSVCRFKCVSKEWHSFLTLDMFQNKHNRHVDDHENNPKLLVLSRKTETLLFEFTTIDCEAPPSDKGLTPTRRPLPQFEDTTSRCIYYILTSFHGLVCLGITKDKYVDGYSGLILWNPLTNDHKRLSRKDCNYIIPYSSTFGLYFSSCEDDNKLLFVKKFHDNVYIYSLKSDSWRKVDVSQHTGILRHGRWSGGTYLNENLYFLIENSTGRLGSIIRFDTKTERFSIIETPHVEYNSITYHDSATIMVQRGYLHVCVMYDTVISGFKRTCIKLWKLDKYENLKEVVNCQLKRHYFILHPLHLMKNGKLLMTDNSASGPRLYKVDLKKTDNKNKGNSYDEYDAGVRMDTWPTQVRYMETFVSPNKYTK